MLPSLIVSFELLYPIPQAPIHRSANTTSLPTGAGRKILHRVVPGRQKSVSGPDFVAFRFEHS